MVIKAAARPMIQVNVPEHYLSPVQDPPPKTTAEERLSWLEKVILPGPSSLTQEPQYGTHQASSCSSLAPSQMQVFQWQYPPRKLALCLRCEPNNCQSCCQGKVYLGGSTGATKGKRKRSHTVAREGDVAGDKPPSLSPLQEVNVIVTGSSSTGSTKMGFIHNYTRVTTRNCIPPPQLSV